MLCYEVEVQPKMKRGRVVNPHDDDEMRFVLAQSFSDA